MGIVVPGLTQHTIVLCVEKRERGIPLQAILSKMGLKTIVCQGLSEAMREMPVHLPHLIVTEALLGDGNAGMLYDKLKADPILKSAPVYVLVLKKSKEEILPLKGKSFAGISAGALQPAQFAGKVKELLSLHADGSPYLAAFTRYSIASDCQLALSGSVVGNSNGQVVIKSSIEIDPAASLVLVPTNKKYSPVLLKMGSNLKTAEDIYNLFPINRAKGKGMEWLMELPAFDANGSSNGSKGPAGRRKVIFQDPVAERANQMKQILQGYDIELVVVQTLQQAASLIKRDTDTVGCVYFHELVSGGAGGIAWKEAYESIEASKRPPMVVGTSSLNARSNAQIRYIKRPYGIGPLVQTLEAAFERPGDLTKAAESKGTNIEIEYQAPIKIIGLDETGGIIQLKFPVVSGSQIALRHDNLKDLMSGDSKVRIVSSGVFPDKPDTWQARFESVAAGTSKSKYMVRVHSLLKQFELPQEKPEAPASPATLTAA